ncbi:MAG TPA: hypothetical protein PK893_11990 [Candidatus Competibacteraceae bacterium]|nr:MAG: hypothetical protein EKK71_01450 [Candidatus Competibacteraceae bacterium]HQA26862.1 hypothetical protein [Candidatus Competibacteraceae bacterium]HQD57361.1 hypothetical protein [Candidatus Competibacteraceae bacterium]
MNKLTQVGVVGGGYAAALLFAGAAFYLRQLSLDATDQASSGMSAFGDLLLFIGLFGFLALIPTGLALYFLRPFEPFWTVASLVAVVLATTAIWAGLTVVWASNLPNPLWGVGELIGILRLLVAPGLALVFAMAALFAPIRRPRWLLFGAAVTEGLVSLSAVAYWLLA